MSTTHLVRRIFLPALTLAVLSIVTSQAAAQVQSNSVPRYNGSFPSPSSQPSNLSTVGFRNTGFQNTGFQNAGFGRHSGFPNGVQNWGRTSFYNGGGYVAPAGANPNFINQGNYAAVPQLPAQVGPGQQAAMNANSNGLLPGPEGNYAPVPQDNTATIMLGANTNPGSTVNSLAGTAGARPVAAARPGGARYTLGLGFTAPQVAPGNPTLENEIQSTLSRSERVTTGKQIQVTMEGSTAILRGPAADEHDRDLAEALVRLTPGVTDVRNELQVPGGGIATSSR